VTRRVPAPTFWDTKARPLALTSAHGSIADWRDGLAFESLGLAYRDSGGIARADDIGRMLADHGPGTFISMARLLDDKVIFAFRWNASLWIPMFQFDLSDLSLRVEPGRIRAELGETFDGWALAAWFVEPNEGLAGRRPIDVQDSAIDAVLHAARVDSVTAPALARM